MIFANHAHVFPKEVNEMGSINSLKKVMQKCNINKVVAFAPFPAQIPDKYDSNKWLYNKLKKEKNIFGFGIIDFDSDNINEQVEKIVSFGFKGIKLHPAFQKFNVLSEKAYQVYQKAQEHNLFLCFHTCVHWHRLKDYHPLHFDDIAQDFPELKINLEHLGGFSFFQEAVGVISNNIPPLSSKKGNVYGGLTSIFDKKKNPNRYLEKEKINKIIPMIGSEQLIFGLDFPYYQEEEIKKALKYIDTLKLTNEEKDNILYKNLNNLLN